MMKKLFAVLLCAVMMTGWCCAETVLPGHAQLAYETIRWDVNLPKTAELVSANEYLFKMTKEITLHALLMEVRLSDDLEAMYGTGGRLMLVDLDSGMVIDYKTYDQNVRWPDSGDVTSTYDALHLLYGSYWGYMDGGNEFIMSEHEFVTPMAEEDVAAVNAALEATFRRPVQ